MKMTVHHVTGRDALGSAQEFSEPLAEIVTALPSSILAVVTEADAADEGFAFLEVVGPRGSHQELSMSRLPGAGTTATEIRLSDGEGVYRFIASHVAPWDGEEFVSPYTKIERPATGAILAEVALIVRFRGRG